MGAFWPLLQCCSKSNIRRALPDSDCPAKCASGDVPVNVDAPFAMRPRAEVQTSRDAAKTRSEKLLWACAYGDLDRATALLTEECGNFALAMTARDDLGFGPLHFACASGCLPLVELLLSPACMASAFACAKPCTGDAEKGFTTPVAIAALHGHVPVVQLLAAQGTLKPDAPAPQGWEAWNALLPSLADCQGGRVALPAPLLPHFAGSPVGQSPALQSKQPAGEREEVRRWLERHFAGQGGSLCAQSESPMALPPPSSSFACSPFGSEAASPGRSLRDRRGLATIQVQTGSRSASKERRPVDPNTVAFGGSSASSASAGNSVSGRTNLSVFEIRPEIASRSLREGDTSSKTPPTRTSCCIAWLPATRAR